MTIAYSKTVVLILAIAVIFLVAPFFAHAAQILTPSSDTATNSWTTTPLWSKIDDDSTANPTGDGTTIQSDAVGNNVSTSIYDFKLSSGTDPSSSSGHILRVRWNHNQSGKTMSGTFELWQGTPGPGTLIATFQVTPDVTTSENEATYTLTGTEADNITDYTDLYGSLYGEGTGGGPGRNLIVDLAELEIPDAGAGSPPTVTTATSTNINFTTATLNGNITAEGSPSPNERGFAWGTNSSLSGGDTSTTSEFGSFSTGAFSSNLSSLTAGETYYFRAYAANTTGTSTGSIFNFRTAAAIGQPRVLRLGTFLLLFGTLIIY